MTERPTPLLDRTLRSLREQLLQMGALSEEILSKSLESLLDRDIDLAKQVFDDDLDATNGDSLQNHADSQQRRLRAVPAASLRRHWGSGEGHVDAR